MSKLIDLFNSLDKNNEQCNIFIQNLLTVSSDLPMEKKDIDTLLSSIISVVQNYLSKAGTRSEGFSILINILPKCSKEILTEYVPKWIPRVIQVLENGQSTVKDLTLACKALSTIIVLGKEIPDLQKRISMETVKTVISVISNLDESQQCGGILHVIATMLYYYKEPTEKLQATIRKIITSLVDSDKMNLINAGAKCNALLAKATERSFKPLPQKPNYTSWIYNEALLCNSLHLTMDDLFSGILQLDSVDIWAHSELPPLSNENVIDYYTKLEKRFRNLCIFLTTMLRGCAGKNSVCPADILKLVCRGLAISPENLENNTFKNLLLSLTLPKIHIHLLMVLNVFVDNFSATIVPYTSTILKLYQQTLKWTEKVEATSQTISGSKPFSTVRIAVYESLAFWLTRMGSFSGISTVAENISHYIFSDLIPDKDEILLTVQKNHNLSRKVAKKLRNSQYENSAALGSASIETKDPLVNAKLCQAALKALQKIFNNSGCLLKENIFTATQQLIVPILYSLYLGNDKQSFYAKNQSCRLELLKALRVLHMNPNPLTPPPTQYVVEIFSFALNDNSPAIVEEAKLALAALEKVIHPNGPTLSFPPTPPNSQTEDEEETNLLEKRPQRETLDRLRDILKDVQNLELPINGNVKNGQKRNASDEDNADEGSIGNTSDEGMDVYNSLSSKKQKLQIVESIIMPKPDTTSGAADESVTNECSVLNDTTEHVQDPLENPREGTLDENQESDKTPIVTEDEDSYQSIEEVIVVTETPEKPKDSLDDAANRDKKEAEKEDDECEMMSLFVDEVRID